MPWTPSESTRHTHKAKSAKRKRQWAIVANSILEKTGDEGRAVRGANAAVKKAGSAKRKVKRNSSHGHAAQRKRTHHKKIVHKKVAGKR